MISAKKRNAYIRVDGEFHNRIHEVVLGSEHDAIVATLQWQIDELQDLIRVMRGEPQSTESISK